MARIGGYRVGFRRNVDPMRLVNRAVYVILGLWVLQVVVNIMGPLVGANNTSGMFYPVYQFLGITGTGSGILVIGGVMLGISILNDVLQVNR